MKQTDVTVTFYLKKSEMNDEGHCPVMAKLVVGKFSEAAFSAKMSVPAALWASVEELGKHEIFCRQISPAADKQYVFFLRHPDVPRVKVTPRGKSTGNWTICELQPFPFMTNCQPPVRM